MNPEIHSIVEDMMKQAPTSFIHTDPDPQSYHLARLAKLLSLLAEEAETQNKEVSKQTEKIIKLTKAIYILTFTLLGIGIIQIILTLKCS